MTKPSLFTLQVMTIILATGATAVFSQEPTTNTLAAPPISTLSRPNTELADRIVAWVDEDPITLSELEEAFTRYQANREMVPAPMNDASLRKALVRLIDETLLLKQAKKANLSPPVESIDNLVESTLKQMERQFGGPASLDDVLKEAGQDRDSLRDKLRKQRRNEWSIVRAVSGRFTISDEDIAQFEKERKASGQSSERYYLQHIFFPVSPDALSERWDKVIAMAHAVRIEAQRRGDFSAVGAEWVRSHAADQVEAGSLGAMAPEELLPELAEAVKMLEPGQSCPPVRTQKGIHILYLDRKTGLRQILFSKRYEEARQEWLKELRAQATIQVSPRILDN